MLKIALTGGIGSGKTSAANCFAALGVPVIDADQIARELVKPDQPALQSVVDAFGPTVLDGAGQLDRARLRAQVFNDPARRKQLEAILHPLIRAEMRRRVAGLDAPYCLLSIPLLVEGGSCDVHGWTSAASAGCAGAASIHGAVPSAIPGGHLHSPHLGVLPGGGQTGLADIIERILVVDAPEELQYQRVRERDRLADAEIAAILRAQASRQQRLAVADDVIINDGDLENLRQQVLQLHQLYQGLAACR